MKLLFYGLNYAPELAGIGRFSGEMAAWLAARGHDVRAVTAPPYYPDWRVGAGFRADRWRRERRSGVRVLRCPLYVPRRPRGLTRLLHLASFAASSAIPVIWNGRRWRPDVVFTVEPTAFGAPAALLAARLAGARAWLHVQDFELDAAVELGLLPRRVAGLGAAAQRWLRRRFGVVSSVSSRMAERLAAKGASAERIVLFSNWTDIDRIRPEVDGRELRRELGIAEDDFVALYAGNIGRKHGWECLVLAAEAIRRHRRGDDRPVRIVVVGEGAGRAELDAARSAHGLAPSALEIFPLQPESKLPALLASADVHLLPQRAEAADLVMPSKLGGMLASGRPTVAAAAAATQLGEVVSRCGVIVPPGDGNAMGTAVLDLARDPARRRQLAAAARAEAEANWDRERILERFERELEARVVPARARA